MTLSSAINTATSSLQATQTQTALVSRNIANANVAGTTRKYADVVTGADGRVEVRSVAQSGNTTLFRNVLNDQEPGTDTLWPRPCINEIMQSS